MKTAIATGVMAGVLTSVAPFELMFFPPVIAFAVLATKSDRRGRLAALAVFVVICSAAIKAPLKWMDRNSPPELSSNCVRVGELTGATDERTVCFASRNPTYREIDRVLRQELGLEVHVGYCGNGSSLLLGGDPLRGPEIQTASAP